MKTNNQRLASREQTRRIHHLALVAWLVVGSCAIPTDPCPTPPEQHPEAWVLVRDQRTGVVIGYICGRQS